MHQVADAISSNATWPALPVRAVKGICRAGRRHMYGFGAMDAIHELQGLRMEALLELFAKLIAIALFIERTVEVLLAPWRGLGYHRMTAQVKQTKAKLDNGEAGSAEELSSADNDLREYKGETKQMAFLMALPLGMTISAIGLRGLEFFLDPNSLNLPAQQKACFPRARRACYGCSTCRQSGRTAQDGFGVYDLRGEVHGKVERRNIEHPSSILAQFSNLPWTAMRAST